MGGSQANWQILSLRGESIPKTVFKLKGYHYHFNL